MTKQTMAFTDTCVGAVCDRFGGEVQTGPFGSQLHASDYSEIGVPVVMPQDMFDGRVTTERIARVGIQHVKRLQQHVLRPGDIAFSRRGDVGRFAVITEEEDGWLCGTGSIRIRLNCPEVDTSYLRWYLAQPTVRSWLEHNATGVTMPNLNTSVVRQLPLAYPPLTEQRRIAAILDKADALRTKRREALVQLDRLAQSIFVEMFGDPVTNPKGWPMEPLTEVCHCYSGGTPSKANAGYWQGTLPWFSAKDLKADNLFDSQDHISPSVTQTTNLKLLPLNTVAIVVRGMILAHTFPVSVLRVPATINQDLKALLPRKPIGAQFLAACIRAQERFVLEKVSEAGHGTKRLDTLGLQEVRIPKVSDSLQLEFEVRYEAVEQLRAKQSTAEAEAHALFTSLQHRAFRGEL